ncbi:MAG: RpoL/Rpb11 RNA polymerase subunit family protein [Acidilobus sp.]
MVDDLKISKVSERSYVVTIEGEDHTIGNLLASTLMEINGVRMAYYEMEHPLFRRVKVYVNLEEGYDIKDVLRQALVRIKEMNEAFRKAFLEKAKEMGLEEPS